MNVGAILGAAIVACTLVAGDAAAEGRTVTVALRVSARGLDLKTPAGARELYSRLKNAAWIACTRANRVGLEPSPDPHACSEKALGEAIRSVKSPLLTQVYLDTHLPRDAAAYGIEMPVHVATK
ncbi:MAG TPA: UrcA family protein [Steroidobacteraceae bacterium]|nr:UrcA family protein [Steroidobacteraceae bacterium]